MKSYESDVKEKAGKKKKTDDKVDIHLLKFLWQLSPLGSRLVDNYALFFKRISMLNSFSDFEINIFCKFLHKRIFNAGDVIFNQDDAGYGFYFIFDGSVQVYANYGLPGNLGEPVVRLEKYQYFGEMGLLEEYNKRNATVIAQDNTILLGLFKPDLQEMISSYPLLGAKFYKEVSLIMSTRLGHLTREIVSLKKRILELEEKLNKNE